MTSPSQSTSSTGRFCFWLLFYSINFFQESSCGDREALRGGEDRSSASSYPRSYNELRGGASSSSDLSINEIPRLPVWNGATYGDGQRQIDFTQLFELMGEPRGTRGRELSELITRPRPKCNRRIRILNGVTRIRERGSLARFQCSHGYTLIGPTTVVCLRERWSEDPPICVRSGCRPLRKPENGEVRQSIGGAVAAFYCSPNAVLIGNPVIFCDGSRWNGTEPICHVELPPTTASATVSPTTLDDGIESELEWDTNLDGSQTAATTNASLPDNLSGAMSESSTMSSDGESSTDNTPIFIPFSTQAPSSVEQDLHPVSTTINETGEAPHYMDPVRVAITATSEKDEIGVASSTAPYQDQKQITTISRERETPLPFPLPPQISVTSMPSNSGMMATSSISSEISVTEFQQSISEIVPLSMVSFSPPSQQRFESTTAERNSSDDSVYQTATTFRAIPSLPTTTTRRFKILTKRPRPFYTRKPGKRPIRRRTTTTTMKPRIPRLPPRKQGNKVTFRPPPIIIKTAASLPTSPPRSFLVPDGPRESSEGKGGSVDYAIAIDKEFLPREHVPPIQPVEIKPDMLNINVSRFATTGSRAEHSHQLAHSSIIGGIIFFVIGLFTFSAGVVLYCWRKNKGIARARPYDMDGRTLSLHDANDDFMWLEQSRRDNSAL